MATIEKLGENKLGWILMIVAFLGLTGLVVSHFTDAAQLLKTLKKANLFWIGIGAALHILYFVTYAVLYKYGFNTVEVQAKVRKLLPLMMASIFVRAVIPSGGATAAALFVDDAAQRGQSAPKATIGVVLVLLIDLITLVPFVLWGVVFLIRANALQWYDILGLVFFLAYIGVMIGMLALADRSGPFVIWFLDLIRRMVNRVGAFFHKPGIFPEEWPKQTAGQFSQAAQAMISQPRNLAVLAFWGVLLHAVNLVGLWALVKAFGQNVPIGGLVAAFGMGVVFFVIGVIPEGVAIVETIMTLVFTSVGIARGTAIAITMVFRGVNFWLPIAVGLFTFGRLKRFGKRNAEQKEDAS